MQITLCSISSRLEQYDTELLVSRQDCTVIYGVELNTERLTLLDPGVLYITSSEESLGLLLDSDCINILYAAPCAAAANDALNRCSDLPVAKNLILLRNAACGAAVYHELRDLLYAWRRFNTNCEKLHNMLLQGCDLQKLLDEAYGMLENPFALCDMSFTLIATPRQLKQDAPVAEFLATYDGKGGFSSCYDVYRNKRRFEMVNLNDYPQLIIEHEIDNYAYMISNIRINGQLAAFISVFEYERPFHEFDYELVAVLCKMVSLEMQKDSFLSNASGKYDEYLLYHLLEKDSLPNPIPELSRLSSATSKASGCYMLVISIRDYERENTMLQFLSKKLEEILPGAITLIYKGCIIAAATRCSSRRLLPEDLQDLQTLLLAHSLQCGISQRFNCLSEVRPHYQQARKALKLGSTLHKGEVLYFYEKYVLYDLLELSTSVEKLRTHCHPALAVLLEYDSQYNTCFTTTLYCYLQNVCNQSKTAQALHIQRSTLVYRIKKIQEIADIQLGDAELGLHLGMSFKMLELAGDWKNGDRYAKKPGQGASRFWQGHV
ncbi:hypothetical protein A3842_27815 [Paenibacillus sp. P3E]|uniref:PucR family transcriptional regulator n=1 Tax=Paenibacillus sp. P3E TaxID=1349435 RepID=UPI0009405756|nr:helix-turn-helix domain-containing protein [Paenibacillus sp. P3E]OKP67954.1 hypothetical protein A3842_27815 [Paenibacillus sp. P3E]